MLFPDHRTDSDDHDDDLPAMDLTEVRNDEPDGGDLVGWVGKNPHARHWAALRYLDAEGSMRTVALGDGSRYTEEMIESWVSGVSLGAGETGYAVGTVLFSCPTEAKLFLLDADEVCGLL